MRGFVAANEVARFVFEIAALVALGWGAFQLDIGAWRVVLAIAAVLVATTIWGLFVAPKANHRLSDPARLALEVVFFGAAGLTLAVLDHLVLGLAVAVLAIANALLLRRYEGVLGAID